MTKAKLAAEKETLKDKEDEFDAEGLPDSQDIGKEKEEDEVEEQDEPAGPSPEEAIEKMKEQMARLDADAKAANERANKAEKEKGAAEQKVITVQEQAIITHEKSIESSIDASNAQLETIERKLEEAQATGDIKAMVAQQRELAKATMALANAEAQKAQFEIWKQQNEQQIEFQKQQAQQQQAAPKYHPEVQRWIDNHPQFNSDSTFRAEAKAADAMAVEMGYTVGTPAYFEFIDKRIARAYPDESEQEEEIKERAPPPKKKQPLPAAAPSREGVTGKSRNWKDMELTAAEREAAEISGITEEEYKQYKYGPKQKGK